MIRDIPIPYKNYGKNLEQGAIDQMEIACRLPVVAAGALMPDAHVGYGLPIGGVIAVYNAIIPFAVGMDIACRMRMTVYDADVSVLGEDIEKFKGAIARNTRFGVGSHWNHPLYHPVIDNPLWHELPVVDVDKARSQLGSSGHGNHFVEFGSFRPYRDYHSEEYGSLIKDKEYLALLSHGGSRGTGADIARHFSKVAENIRGLPQEFKRLSWLDIDSEEGPQYWLAMNLMGQYAAANHLLIHNGITRSIGLDTVFFAENHHNFAWNEESCGESYFIHRKGATPAHIGQLGIIPGDMGSPGFLVEGKGNPDSLMSASHGAGRAMSRTQAKKVLDWDVAMRTLKERGITLMSGALDEVMGSYKDIHAVMALQKDLVDTIGQFDPKLVKMGGRNNR